MSQSRAQQRSGQAKEKSQEFADTIYGTTVEVFDASISIAYYLFGIVYGLFFGFVRMFQNKKVQADIKQSLNGAKESLLDAKDGLLEGAYDLKSRYEYCLHRLNLARIFRRLDLDLVFRVNNASQSAVDDAQPKVDQAKSKVQAKTDQAQGKAADVKSQAENRAGQAQGKAADYKSQAENKAGQAQGKAADVKNQAVHQGKQAQDQVKQTAQANGIKA